MISFSAIGQLRKFRASRDLERHLGAVPGRRSSSYGRSREETLQSRQLARLSSICIPLDRRSLEDCVWPKKTGRASNILKPNQPVAIVMSARASDASWSSSVAKWLCTKIWTQRWRLDCERPCKKLTSSSQRLEILHPTFAIANVPETTRLRPADLAA